MSLLTAVSCCPVPLVQQGGPKELVPRVRSSNCKDLAFWRYREVGGCVLLFGEHRLKSRAISVSIDGVPAFVRACCTCSYVCPGSASCTGASSPCCDSWFSSNSGSLCCSVAALSCMKSGIITRVKPRTLTPNLKPSW